MPANSLFERCPDLKSYTVTVFEWWTELDVMKSADKMVIKDQDHIAPYSHRFPMLNYKPLPINLENVVWATYSGHQPKTTRSIEYPASVGDDELSHVSITCTIEYKKEKSTEETLDDKK